MNDGINEKELLNLCDYIFSKNNVLVVYNKSLKEIRDLGFIIRTLRFTNNSAILIEDEIINFIEDNDIKEVIFYSAEIIKIKTNEFYSIRIGLKKEQK